MYTARNVHIFAALAGLLPGLTTLAAHSADAPRSWGEMPVGTHCFQVGSPQGPNFNHLKLQLGLPRGAAPYNIAPVSGLQRGYWNDAGYVDQLSGTATLAPSNDTEQSGWVLQIGLTGNSYDVIAGSERADQLWILQYSLQLNPDTRSGMLYGAEFASTALVDGEPFAADPKARRTPVTPLDCAEF